MKYGFRCECGTVFRRTGTRTQYANAKIEHSMKCRKAWDLLVKSGKPLKLETRPASKET
jgi:hypothetical protein